jgi:hypothetical protein
VEPSRTQIVEWTERLVADCRQRLTAVLPFTATEREFLDRLNERGKIVPELLTKDKDLQATIRSHPGILWKALNVRKHRGVPNADET